MLIHQIVINPVQPFIHCLVGEYFLGYDFEGAFAVTDYTLELVSEIGSIAVPEDEAFAAYYFRKCAGIATYERGARHAGLCCTEAEAFREGRDYYAVSLLYAHTELVAAYGFTDADQVL